MISSEGAQHYVAKAAERGVNGFLVKPFSQQALLDRIEKIFELRFNPPPGFMTAREADQLLEAGDLAGALDKFKEAIQASKNSMAVLQHKIGGVYEKLERDDEAEESYNRSIKMSDLFVDSYDALGALHMRQGREEEAAYDYKNSIAISPLNATRQFHFGEALLGAEQFGEAETAFRQSLELDPAQTHIFNRLGISLRRQRKLDEAIKYFDRALEVTKDDENLYFNAGQVYYLNKDAAAARDFFQKALELNPDFKEAREMIKKVDALEKLNESV